MSVDAHGAITRPSCPFERSTLRLTLNRIAFTRPDRSPLQPEIAETLSGIDMPTGDQSIRVVCDAANAALHRRGWVASVQIPPQSLVSGELTRRSLRRPPTRSSDRRCSITLDGDLPHSPNKRL